MAKEICISSTPHETRLAILEDDQLAEIYYERENEFCPECSRLSLTWAWSVTPSCT
jgi:NMD protein affecting ribosome stability and mRNA decay